MVGERNTTVASDSSRARRRGLASHQVADEGAILTINGTRINDSFHTKSHPRLLSLQSLSLNYYHFQYMSKWSDKG